MDDGQRMALIEALAKDVTDRVIDGLLSSVRCCPNCAFWQKKEETCRNTVNCPQLPARPPAGVIAFGCKLFIPDMPT